MGRAVIVVAAACAISLPAAGCGAGSPGPAPATAATAQTGALAFARCMRAHGIPGWPDPTSDGHFDKAKLRQLAVGAARVRALESGPCSHLLAAGPPGPTLTPADRSDYLHAAACMRRHGYPDFPDPTFRGGRVATNIPASIDQDAARFRSAAAICTKLIPAGLPYSSRGAS
jgi:hypothetical protein